MGRVGMVRNTKGQVVVAFLAYYEEETNNMAEAKAILDGLIKCWERNLVNIGAGTQLESGSYMVERKGRGFLVFERFMGSTLHYSADVSCQSPMSTKKSIR